MIELLAIVLTLAAGTIPAGPGEAKASASTPFSPAFSFSSERISPEVRGRIVGVSWHKGCPVPLADLRYLRVRYWTFKGGRQTGELIVHRDAVEAIRQAFSRLFDAEFPIRRMRLVDDFKGDDFASIEADNTSAFNCRQRTGGGGWSEHAMGRAIDVNPIENPYVYPDGTTSHRASRKYLDRSRVRPGMATKNGVLVRAFRKAGWGWGGSWTAPRDYQHFSAKGR
jgi:hypothetical protein